LPSAGSCGPIPNDCNANGTPDACELSGQDCNANGLLDACEPDCQPNGVPDDCDIAGGFSQDCNLDAVPDECQSPPAVMVSAVSRKLNPSGPGGVCDQSLLPARTSEPHVGGITEVRIGYNVPPGSPCPAPLAVSLEQSSCAAPALVPYSGAATMTCAPSGSDLVCLFAPGLENARTYRITVTWATVTAMVELRGLIGDVNSDGFVNATDRSVVVGAWTGGGFSCPTDVNRDGSTNATDRSIVVGAWTGLGGWTCPTDVDNNGSTNATDRSITVGAWTGGPGANCAP
jgi:hypothetical protein